MAKRLAHIPGTTYERVAFLTSSSPYAVGDPFVPAVHLDVRYREYNRLLRIKRPIRVFLGSMGDIANRGLLSAKMATFGENGDLLPREQWWTGEQLQNDVAMWCASLGPHGRKFLVLTKEPGYLLLETKWPGNVFLGVSVTGNDDAWRVERLLARDRATWAWGSKIRLWASVEPLVDPNFDPDCLAGLDWVVVGLRTGAGAPDGWPMIEAAKRIVSWCARKGVPCFVKENVTRWKLGPGEAWTWPREIAE
jgi:hypothetical protein